MPESPRAAEHVGRRADQSGDESRIYEIYDAEIVSSGIVGKGDEVDGPSSGGYPRNKSECEAARGVDVARMYTASLRHSAVSPWLDDLNPLSRAERIPPFKANLYRSAIGPPDDERNVKSPRWTRID